MVPESWVQRAFTALADTTEAYFWSAVGPTHIPPPSDATAQIAVPWFRWKLLGDRFACNYFKSLPDNVKWVKKTSQAEMACP